MLLAVLSFIAQIAITGRVIDHEGHAVAGATVTLVEAHQAVTSRADGTFSFSAVPTGTYTLVARRLGYAPAARRISIDGTVPEITLSLGDTPFRAEPISVTATRGAVETFLSPMPISVLTAERLHREAGISLAKSLTMLPGVRDVSTGLQIGKPMVRGLYGARVLVLHDGSRLEDYSWSEEDGPSIDARLAERVEVIRGPASVLYGSDALGGVVNVVPEVLPFSADGTPVRRATIEGYGASNNIELGSAAKVEGANGKFGWRLFGTGRFAQSYSTPDGEVDNTGFLSVNVDAAGAYRGDNHSATLRFSHYGGEFRLLEANGPQTPPPGAKDAGPERKLLDDRVQFSGNHLWGNFRLEGKAQFQRHSLMEVSDDCVPPPGQTTCTPPPPGQEATAFDLLLSTGTVDVLGHHAIGSRTTGVVGVSGMFQSNDSRGPIFLVPSATITSGAAFALEDVNLGKVHLVAGARVDSRKLSADANAQLQLQDDSRSWTAGIGQAGIVVNPTASLALVGNVGMGWRAPTLFDLYANGPHLAEARYEIGDPTLEAERAVNADVGVRWSSARARAELSAFQNQVDNFIYVTPTAQTQNGLQVFRHVQRDARLRGAEAIVEANVTGPLTLRVQHDFVRGIQRASGAALPLMPPPRTVVGGELRSSRLTWARRAMIGLEAERVEKQTHLDPNDFPTEGYTLINIDTEVERALRGRVFQFDFDVRNASNRTYRNFLSRYKQFAPNPGINFVLRLSTQL